MKFLITTIVALTASAGMIIPSVAQQPASNVDVVAEKTVLNAVASRMRCKAPSGPVTRRAFAGGFVFNQTCTDSGVSMDRIVFATDRDGARARLLQFHRPEGRRVSALGNVEFVVAENEIAGTTGKLTRRICRAEGRWRMEGKQPAPGLVFWRQTADCEGKTGWQTTVNRKR